MSSTELDLLTHDLHDLERDPGKRLPDLSSITSLLEKKDNPHKKIRTVHIAGTNGKGSTAWYLEALLRSHGIRTGLYTSPHLIDVRERIRVNGEMIPENDLVRILTELLEIIHGQKRSAETPSYFDVITAAAFQWFHESKTELCVIETGLGGRLDSTNVIYPEYVLFTALSLDHVPLLGNDILSVAGEKFGIIKEGVPVFSLRQDSTVQSLLKQKCRALNCRLFLEGKDWLVENIHYDGEDTSFRYSAPSSESLHSLILKSTFPFQSSNAGLALAVFEYMNDQIGPFFVREILAECRIPGRRERLSDYPPVIFDAAHNPSALSSVVESLSSGNREIILIVAFMKDKAVSEMMNILTSSGWRLRYLVPDENRAFVPSAGEIPARVFTDVEELVEGCREDPENVLYFFTGTFRIYSMALDFSRMIGRT